MDTCIWMAECLHYSLETITAWFVNHLYSSKKIKSQKKRKGAWNSTVFPKIEPK